MDFAVLPPEVNSARMYAGPGSGPMLAAAMAWDELAATLHSTADSYQAEITALTSGPWVGPSAAAMIAAITPYLTWMRTTGAQAEETANNARAAAFAYETAFAETVPPRWSRPTARCSPSWSRPTSWGRTRRRSPPPRRSTPRCGRATRPPCAATPAPPPRRPG